MYCHNCGAEIADDANVCPYCGVPVKGSEHAEIIKAKDNKIREMEKKIQRLEATVTQDSEKKQDSNDDPEIPMGLIIGLPLAFVAMFFIFFIILVISLT